MPRTATPDGPGERVAVLSRTTIELRKQLEHAAAQSGRSLGQEVERRLERTFDLDYMMGDNETASVLRMIGNAVRRFEVKSGKQWSDDAATQEAACDAVLSIVKAVMGPLRGNAPGYTDEAIPIDSNDSEEMLGLKGMSLDVVIAELQTLRRTYEQRSIALRKPVRK